LRPGGSKSKGALRMPLQITPLNRQPIASHAAAAAGREGDSLPPRGHTFVWPDSPNVPSTVLVKLLNSAQEALAGDVQEARQFIVKAADLISAEVERREATEHSDIAEPVNRHLAPWQTRRVIEFIEENLEDTIRIEDLAEIAHLSGRQFSRAFRSDFGEAPYAYVVRQRIERAKEMMLLTDEPLANIAAKIGLSDQPHLTRLFHRIVGESPASWRRHHRSLEA
jgi:AraC family transcriptional regulator